MAASTVIAVGDLLGGSVLGEPTATTAATSATSVASVASAASAAPPLAHASTSNNEPSTIPRPPLTPERVPGPAPSLPVTSKIQPSKPTQPQPRQLRQTKSSCIIVPQRSIAGGMDTKFESDPYTIRLHDLLSPTQFTDAMTRLNEDMKPSRPTAVDTALLVTGPLIVPLALWGARHGRQVKKKKRLLKKGIARFNTEHPELMMRWNRRPESRLTIERRKAEHGSAPIDVMGVGGMDVGGGATEGGIDIRLGEEDAFV